MIEQPNGERPCEMVASLPVLGRKHVDELRPRAALTVQARALGDGQPAEALWPVLPGADPWSS